MSRFLDAAREYRSRTDFRFNCTQAVLLPFALEKGFDPRQVAALTAHFGGGLRMGAVCGSFAGGLMALGLYGADTPADAGEFARRMKERTDGLTDCRELLARNARAGGDRKAHCDAMVFAGVAIAEEMLRERGLIE